MICKNVTYETRHMIKVTASLQYVCVLSNCDVQLLGKKIKFHIWNSEKKKREIDSYRKQTYGLKGKEREGQTESGIKRYTLLYIT